MTTTQIDEWTQQTPPTIKPKPHQKYVFIQKSKELLDVHLKLRHALSKKAAHHNNIYTLVALRMHVYHTCYQLDILQ